MITPPLRVLLLVNRSRNRHLLTAHLHGLRASGPAEAESGGEQPLAWLEVFAGGQYLNEAFDLVITDGPALSRHAEVLRRRREEERPRFLPTLLVASRKDLTLASAHLWETVDDVVLTPITKLELCARVQVLLRARVYVEAAPGGGSAFVLEMRADKNHEDSAD